uniref:Venom allergen 3 n=1 Tax=Ascaris suum TaxID=6253 RepID=F1L5E5_ASCSU
MNAHHHFTGYVTATNCPEVRNQGFNPSSRHVVLQRHNELRSMVANGTVEYEGGARLRSGKNIYQLSWDCDLEKIAQEWADRCVYGHSTKEHSKDAGENIYMWYTSGSHQSIDTNMLRATNNWWDEIKKYDASKNPKNIMDNTVLSIAGHWSQQAWGATTKIGCGIRNCTEGSWNTTFVVCNYLVAGNYFGKPIFEFGNGCSRDSDCTTYKGSRCNVNNKLCLTDGQTAGEPSSPSGNNNSQPEPSDQSTPKPEPEPTTKPVRVPAKPSGNKKCRNSLRNCTQFAHLCDVEQLRRHCPVTCGDC